MSSAFWLFLITISEAIAISTVIDIGVSVCVKIEGLSPYPSDFQVSAEKLSRKSLNAVSMAYEAISKINPSVNVFTKANLSGPVIGWRLVRSDSSSAEGGGSLLTSHRNTRRGAKNKQAATNGIQYSETCQSRMTSPPTVFPNPAEKMKLTDK